MQKVKTLVRLLVLAAGLGGAVLVARRLMGSSTEWESLGEAPSPAAGRGATTPATDTADPADPAEPADPAVSSDETAPSLPEGYDPLTDPIPPNEL